ncbi:VM3E2-like protein, partial [Mya arenaria]
MGCGKESVPGGGTYVSWAPCMVAGFSSFTSGLSDFLFMQKKTHLRIPGIPQNDVRNSTLDTTGYKSAWVNESRHERGPRYLCIYVHHPDCPAQQVEGLTRVINMRAVFGLALVAVLTLQLVHGKMPNGRRCKVNFQSAQRNRFRKENSLPAELSFSMEVEGQGKYDLDLVLNPRMDLPAATEDNESRFLHRQERKRFYDRNLGDNDAAQNEAVLYVTLLANEMNVFYSSVKEASGGNLDLYVFPSDVVYPQAGTNFAWSGDYVTGDVIDTEGYAYLSTVCRPTTFRYSINEFASYNVAPVAAHELGHALGSSHDSSSNNCPSYVNVMSPYLGTPSGSSVDNFYKFSTCSANYFTAHLDRYPSCSVNTGGLTDEQFEAAFCSGLLGQRDSSLDLQCKRRTRNPDSTACSLSVSGDAGCYSSGQVSCRTSPGGSCSTSLSTYVWNGTPCGSGT